MRICERCTEIKRIQDMKMDEATEAEAKKILTETAEVNQQYEDYEKTLLQEQTNDDNIEQNFNQENEEDLVRSDVTVIGKHFQNRKNLNKSNNKQRSLKPDMISVILGWCYQVYCYVFCCCQVPNRDSFDAKV